MQYTEEEMKFFNDLMIRPKRYIPTTARIPLKEAILLRKWSQSNNYPIAWIVKRAIKDFIKNYCETGLIPPGESVDLGAINRKDSSL